MTIADDDINAQLVPMFEEDARLVRSASGLTDVFVAAMGEHVATWIGEHVASAVKVETTHTASMGPRLSEMKAKLAKLQETAPAAAQLAMKDLPWLWARGRDEPPVPDGSSPVRYKSQLHIYESDPRAINTPRVVDTKVREAYGHVAPLLMEFGYKAAEDFEARGVGDRRGYRYRYGVQVPTEVKVALKAAADADSAIAEHRNALAQRRRELSEAKAKAAWDDA